jgi:hypothetical protein
VVLTIVRYQAENAGLHFPHISAVLTPKRGDRCTVYENYKKKSKTTIITKTFTKNYGHQPSITPIIEHTGINEDDYILLGYCIGLTASELLNVYTAQW